ncbi:hypothetical protein [Novipirellula herctigrandis]
MKPKIGTRTYFPHVSKDDYRNPPLCGYPRGMIAQTSQLIFSPTSLLWLVFSAFAAILLFSALNRRRSALTDALKGFVSRHDEAERSKMKTGPTLAEETASIQSDSETESSHENSSS